MLIIRSLLFDIFFYTFTTMYVLLLFPSLIFISYETTFKIYKFWSKIIIWSLRKIVGIRIVVHGRENIPAQPCIIGFQHQSALDTIIPPLIFDNFILALKKELLFIPFFGAYLYKLQSIFLDRKKGISSLKTLLKNAYKQHIKGKNILIYPQGTRAKVDEVSSVQSGIVAMYKHLNCPIIPASINSGYFWPRKGFIKTPGTVHVVLHPVIQEDSQTHNIKRALEDIFNTKYSIHPLSQNEPTL